MTPVTRRLLAAAALAVCVPAGAVAAAPSASATPAASAASTATAAPSALAADECAELDLDDAAQIRDLADDADAVFVGRVREITAVRRPPGDGPDRGPAGWKHQVVVMVELRGEAATGDRVVVRTNPAEAGQTAQQMGLGKLRADATYLFFVTERGTGGEYVASACGGTTRLTSGLGAALERQLKNVLREPAQEPAVEVEFTAPDEGTEDVPTLGRVVAPGVAISLVGLLGLVLVSRLGRRR